ncbi:MAG: DUF4838 domain-containing protein [Armatimonadetes bacterium]|nr:DUF4838 domain-containing protein [Armatimonadota bacterium]
MRGIALIVALLFAVAPLCLAVPLWSVLSDNAADDEPQITTGVTYTAEPAFSNPADPEGRRLIDRGGAWNDWNNTTGINGTDQTLVFDLKAIYGVGKVSLQFDMDAKPASVEVSLATGPEGPWETVGTIKPEARNGWYDLALDTPRPGRYVRMVFRLKEWGWYLREVKLWGTYGNEPGPGEVLPTERDGDRLLLTKDGQPRASIIVAAQPSAKALRAARDLQEHVLKMSGATLPLRTDDGHWTGTLLLVGPSSYLNRAGVEPPTGYPDNERVILRTVGDQIALVGNDEGVFCGTEFAVQMLLERLGCGWFGPDPLWQVVPRQPTVAVPPLNINHTPAFAVRSVWIGQGKRWYLGGVPLRAGHALDQIIPPGQYFADHPEYFSLIGGKRTAEGDFQLCTSNPDVIRITIEKARADFDAHPEQVMYSLSNRDCGGFCECSECAKTGSNPGARMLTFANAVARGLRQTHPDKWVIFLAYWFTAAAPPEPMQAEPGVSVMVVGSGCHVHPATDALCEANVGWTENLRRWAATGAKMGIYEWYIPGCSHKPWRRLPWVAGETAVRDLQLWRSVGVEWVTYESQTAYEENPYPLRWPLFYVAAKHMWDASLSADEILTDACRKLYGPAASAMRRYYRELEHAMRNAPVHSGIWNLPSGEAIYTPEVCQRLRALLADAGEAAKQGDELVQQRVAAETAVWNLAEDTLAELRAATAPKPVAVLTKGN